MSEVNISEPKYLPRGVADAGGHTGYVTSDYKAIEALDLRTGAPLRKVRVEGLPMLESEGRLAVLQKVAGRDNQLRVVTIDVAGPENSSLQSEPISFPEWVTTSLVPNDSFDYKVTAEDGSLVLSWTARGRYRGGAPPPAYVLERANKNESGAVRVDIESGRVKLLPAAEADAQIPDALEEATVFSYQRGAGACWHTEPWGVGDRRAVITGEIFAGTQRLKLQKWDARSGELEEPAALVEGRALVSYVTPDGHYIFIHSEAQPAQRPWWLFSAEHGQLLAELNYEEGAREPCVIDSCLYYVVEAPPTATGIGGLSLRSTFKSRLIPSGELRWERDMGGREAHTPAALRP